MLRYASPIDIANRALQHLGQQRIYDFTDDSVAAIEMANCYDKLRRAELMRDVWRFATRKAALRPVVLGGSATQAAATGGTTTGTMHVKPVLWSSAITYGFGALATMDDGAIWQSKSQDNLNNQPGNTPQAWDLYAGPVTVQPYDTTGTPGYYAGELVYQSPGDGTYAVWLSMTSGNSQDPRAPSEWVYGTQYANNQVVLFYPAWSAVTTYAAGAAVSYLGADYVSLIAGNLNITPSSSATSWALVPSTLAPQYYNSQTAYSAGQWVSYAGTNYICILAATGQTPSTSPTYWLPQTAGTYYVSLIDFNLNNLPSASPLPWASATTYAIGNTATGGDGNIYTSITNGNIGNDPLLTTGTQWTNTLVLAPWTTGSPFGTANNAWVQVAVALTDFLMVAPISQPGGSSNTNSFQKNIFRLPANYIRRAPQDPKQGNASYLGAPTGMWYDDWEMEGQFITSQTSFVIVLRFVADTCDVSQFDDLFCETLAARMAMETCERITASTSKVQVAAVAYKSAHDQAALINGIETGPTEPPMDDWISCRV